MDALSINNKGNISQTKNILKAKEEKNSSQIDLQKKSEPEAVLSCDNWRALSGVSVEMPKNKANNLINKFALTGKLGVYDIVNLKKIIKSGDKQAENVSRLLSLVNEKSVNSRTLKYVCKDGIMSDGMENDIKMIFDAKKAGVNPDDVYIPHFNSSNDAVNSSEIGDLFEIEGQKNIYIKNKDGEAEQLKTDKEMMLKLFPPAERFANAQTHSSDCYFISTVNSMMDNPASRAYFLQCFEQEGDDVKIKFPSGDYTYTAKNAEMPKTYKGNFVTGSLGMKLVEYAYGKFLENKVSNQVNEIQKTKISNLEQQLETANNEQEKKEIEKKIKHHRNILSKFNEDSQKDKPEYIVVLNQDRKPETNEDEGISLKMLSQMNMYRGTSFQTAGDFYRGDGGFMEDVFKDFGFNETKAYYMEDEEIQYILSNPELSKDYIFSGGTKPEGKQNLFRAELVMDRSLNMYGSHAYRIAPSADENGNTVFKVSNPWNSSHNSVLTMEQLKKFFVEIHSAKIQ